MYRMIIELDEEKIVKENKYYLNDVLSYVDSYFEKKKYELEKSEPFLYYIYRRKTESANVRIIFVCLLAGLSEQEIKARIRGKESV